MVPLIIGFAVNSGAIFLGSRLAKQETNLVQCAMVALVSIITVWLARILLFPLFLLPFLGWLVSALAVCLGTGVAAKFMMNLEWRAALQIGAVVALIQVLIGMVFR
jgi:hypothetical protein